MASLKPCIKCGREWVRTDSKMEGNSVSITLAHVCVPLRVLVCSPFSEYTIHPDFREAVTYTQKDNQVLAAQECKALHDKGMAPFAPHLIYPIYYYDSDPTQREAAIRAGCAFMLACDYLWVINDTPRGISKGMEAEIRFAEKNGIVVKYKREGIPWTNR